MDLILFVIWTLIGYISSSDVEYNYGMWIPDEEYRIILDTHYRNKRQADEQSTSTLQPHSMPTDSYNLTSALSRPSTTHKPLLTTTSGSIESTISNTTVNSASVSNKTTITSTVATQSSTSTSKPTKSSTLKTSSVADSNTNLQETTSSSSVWRPTQSSSSVAESTTNLQETTRSHTLKPTQPSSVAPTSVPDTTTNIPEIEDSVNHIYYTSTVIQDRNYWDELYNHTKFPALDDAHLMSEGLQLSFTMPFYGHNISKIQITTGGFLYMHPWVHRHLTFSQYVAPLMANFDVKGGNAEVLYKEYENESIVVEWRNVLLNDQKQYGEFTFQTKLFRNGTIMLVYKKIPVAIDVISDDNHPVKIGVSDAVHWDFIQNGVHYRLIRKYHEVVFNVTLIAEGTVIILHPLPTCNLATNCDRCVTQEINFECSWCREISLCSDGWDWNYQEWQKQGCPNTAGNTSAVCMETTTTMKSTTMSTTTTNSIPTNSKMTTTVITISHPPSSIQTFPLSTTMQFPESTITTIPTTTSTPMPSFTTPKTTYLSSSTKTNTSPTTIPNTTQKPTLQPTSSSLASTTTTTSSPKITATTLKTTTTTPEKSTTTTTSQSTTQSTTLSTSNATSSSNIPYVARQAEKKESTNKATIIVPLVIIVFLVCVLAAGWVYYAYTHPNTRSGQWLIEHRPSQLKNRFSNCFKWSTETGEKYRVKNEDVEFNMEESVA